MSLSGGRGGASPWFWVVFVAGVEDTTEAVEFRSMTRGLP